MGRRTIRFRVTALATALVAVSLLAAAFALVVLQRNSLTSNLDARLTQRADDIMSLVDEGAVPEHFPGAGTEDFVQLVAGDGTVVASTPNLAGAPPLGIAAETSGGDLIQNVSGLPLDDDEFRVLTRSAADGGVLYVASTYDSVTESVAALATSMSVVVPLLVVSLAGLTWWLVGRTLKPVEVIRREVSEIGGTALHRRVPRPGTQDEIDRLAGTMNEMLERVEGSVVRQQRFVADASHELRSPLTRMHGQLELSIAHGNTPDPKELVDLLDEVRGMEALVEDLLHLARADAGIGPTSTEPVDLDDIVIREAKRIEGRGRKDVDISGVSGAHVLGNFSQLLRAVRNVMENAETYAERLVTVWLAEENGSAILEISDDGPGIPMADRERVLERFARLDESRSGATGGHGLGLAIAREIAALHGGSMSVGDTGGAGASIRMEIPLAPD